MAELLLHRGGQEVNRQELDLIPLPEPTESYTPVSHYHLADKIRTIGNDILTDYCLVGENYAVARNGNQLGACYSQYINDGRIYDIWVKNLKSEYKK